MFAIIKTGGKQINVEVGKEYFIEKLAGDAEDKVVFDQVLMIDGTVGNPIIKGASVHGIIIKQDKAKKIVVFKYKPKKNSKTKYGHRQPYTKVKITDILLSGKPKPATKSTVKKTTTEATTSKKPKTTEQETTKKVTKIVKEPTTKVAATKKPSVKVATGEKKVVKTDPKKPSTAKKAEVNNPTKK